MEKPYLTTLYFFILSTTLSIVAYLGHYAVSANNTRPIQSNDASESNPQQKRLSLSRYYSKLLLVISLSFFWYAVSISFTVYNKWLMKSYRSGFDYPFTTTLAHMIIKYLFSRIYVHLIIDEPVPHLRSNIYIQIVVPIGLTTAFDIGMSNLSISFLTLSLYTIIKTTVVVWTFAWSVIYGLEIFSMSKALSIIGVVAGLSLTVISNISASFWGIFAGTTSAACGGLRWVLIQLLQKHDEPSKSAIIATYRFSAVTVLAMLPLVLGFELQSIIRSEFVASFRSFVEVLELLIIGGILGCILIIVEINLLGLTSSLTMSIIGELKEVLQICLGLIAFQDQFSWMAGLGAVLAVSSAETYRKVKAAEDTSSARDDNGDHDIIIGASRANMDIDDLELMKLIYDTEDEG